MPSMPPVITVRIGRVIDLTNSDDTYRRWHIEG